MPRRSVTPSGHVGPQVRRLRKARGWRQQDLVDRLHELGMTKSGWGQTKVHKLETGKLERVLVDDAFELAAALDVSPLYLLAPTAGFDEHENALKVRIGRTVSRWPWEIRQWVRGTRPLLHRGDYPDDEAAAAGQRHYLVDTQPLSEWQRIREGGDYARRATAAIQGLMPDDEEADG